MPTPGRSQSKLDSAPDSTSPLAIYAMFVSPSPAFTNAEQLVADLRTAAPTSSAVNLLAQVRQLAVTVEQRTGEALAMIEQVRQSRATGTAATTTEADIVYALQSGVAELVVDARRRCADVVAELDAVATVDRVASTPAVEAQQAGMRSDLQLAVSAMSTEEAVRYLQGRLESCIRTDNAAARTEASLVAGSWLEAFVLSRGLDSSVARDVVAAAVTNAGSPRQQAARRLSDAVLAGVEDRLAGIASGVRHVLRGIGVQ